MTREKLRYLNAKTVRDHLNLAVDLTDQIKKYENELVKALLQIDQHRYYIRYGYKSLRGFCIQGLNFGETQAQRIVTLVRRSEPTPRIGIQEDSQGILIEDCKAHDLHKLQL